MCKLGATDIGWQSVTQNNRRRAVELPDGFLPRLRTALSLREDEKPRLSYLSLANDVARVQQYWAEGVQDPKSQKATYAGMFFELIEALDAEGQLFSIKETKPPRGQPVRIERLDDANGDKADLVPQIIARIQGFRPHLLVVSPSVPIDIVANVARDFPTVFYAHSLFWPARWDGPDVGLKDRLKRWVRCRRYQNKLADVAGLIAASDVCLQQFRAITGGEVPEVSVTRQLLTAPEVKSKSSMRRLLFVGGMDRQSGVRDLVASFEKLQGHCPDLQLTLIGDGPFRAEMEAKAENTEGMHFASGFDAQVQAAQVQLADLLVVPEPADALTGTPVFLPEALVCGVPALVSSTVPLSSAERVGCDIFKAGDFGEMENRLRHLYGDDAYQDLCARVPVDDAPYRDATQSWGSGIARIFGEIAGI